MISTFDRANTVKYRINSHLIKRQLCILQIENCTFCDKVRNRLHTMAPPQRPGSKI